MKLILSLFSCFCCLLSYSQSAMTPKEAFYYGLNITEQNASTELKYNGFIGSSSKTYQWGDFYASYFDKENYIKAANDEFKRVPYLTQKFKELNEGIKNVDFSKTFSFIVRTGFGMYDGNCGCFPLNEKDFLAYNHVLLNIKEVGNDKLAFDNSFAKFTIRNYANFNDFEYALKINSADAEKFIESRKDNSGNISRQVTLKVTYNLLKDGNNGITAYIHKIDFYNGQNFLSTILPQLKTNTSNLPLMSITEIAGTYLGSKESQGQTITIKPDGIVEFTANLTTYKGKVNIQKTDISKLDGIQSKINSKFGKDFKTTGNEAVFNITSGEGTKVSHFMLVKSESNLIVWGGGDAIFEKTPNGNQPKTTIKPEPIFKVGSGSDSIPIAAFRNQQFVRAELENTQENTRFQIISFRVSIIAKDSSKYGELINSGSKISDSLLAVFQKLKQGDIVIFKEILLLGADEKQFIIKPRKIYLY